MTPQVSIQISSTTCSAEEIPDCDSFQRWAAATITAGATVGVRIVGTAEGRRFNRRFRRINRATNVLSFPFTTEILSEQNYLGDVLLTAPLVIREARTLERPLYSHWAHLFIHALLHLQGYSHSRDDTATVMAARESAIMTVLGFADPWASDLSALKC